jgi:antibiotic biosynthesis monooxygenase (ABM) superfamily enzyme
MSDALKDAAEGFEYRFEQRVDPAHVQSFYRFSDALHTLASQQPGFLSQERHLLEQRPGAWLFQTSVRFQTIQQCFAWLDHPKRRRLIVDEEEQARFRFRGQANWMGYGRWLSRNVRRPTPTWKVNILVLLTLYPTVMALTPVLHLTLKGASLPTVMLVSNALCVATTSWLLVPVLSRLYLRWLEGDLSNRGALLALGSLLAALVLLWAGFQQLPSGVWS